MRDGTRARPRGPTVIVLVESTNEEPVPGDPELNIPLEDTQDPAETIQSHPRETVPEEDTEEEEHELRRRS